MNKIKYKVYKDVLPEEQWKHLHDFISNAWFSWTYAAGTSHSGEGYNTIGDTPQLVRNFFHREQVATTTAQAPNPFNESIQTHEYLQALPQIMMIAHKLLPNHNPLRIKANLLQPYPDAPEHHPCRRQHRLFVKPLWRHLESVCQYLSDHGNRGSLCGPR